VFLKRLSILYITFLFLISCSKSKVTINEIDIVYENEQMLFKKNSKLFTGLIFEYYDDNDDDIKIEINVINGLKDGVFKQYYRNGKIQVESKFNRGELFGKFNSFHENGNQQIIAFYEKNLKMGSFEEFYDDKKLKICGSYFMGVEIGQFEEYFKSGGEAIYNY
jgi:antitoxin component YwqK of YwqJK toxin-antitoxin module